MLAFDVHSTRCLNIAFEQREEGMFKHELRKKETELPRSCELCHAANYSISRLSMKV